MTSRCSPAWSLIPALSLPDWRVSHATPANCDALERTKPPRFLSRKLPDAVNAKPLNRPSPADAEADARADLVAEHPADSPCCPARNIDQTGVSTAAEVEHWDILFSAILARLGHAADALSESRRLDAESVAQMQATVQECIEALEQLHATKRRDFVVRA